MKKFIKVALLENKERLDAQEIQLEEVRTNKTYSSINDALEQQHKNINKSITESLNKKFNDPDNEFFENLLDQAGLYSRQYNKNNKTLGFMVDSTNKGVDERHIQEKLKERHTNK